MLNHKINQINYKKILTLLIMLILFNFNNVNADNTFEITSFSNFSGTEYSKACGDKHFCATDNIAGVRITLTNSNGTKIDGTKTKNFWQSSTVANGVENNATVPSEIANDKSYTNVTNMKMINFSCTKNGVTNPDNCIENVSLNERLSSSNKLYFGTTLTFKASMYKGFIDSLNNINVPMIVEELKGDISITNYDGIYFKLEPVYTISEKYNYNPNGNGDSNKDFQSFFVGTSKEIINNWGELTWSRYYGTVSTSTNPSSLYQNYAGNNYTGNFNRTNISGVNCHSIGSYYVSGGCNETISGYWNVIRNYIVSMYVDCSSTSSVPCYNSNKYGPLSKYKSVSAPKKDGKFTRKGTYSEYCDGNNNNTLNELYLNGNGLGVGYVKVSDYIYGELKISKYKEDTNNLITNSAATFNIYTTSNCTGDYISVKTRSGVISHKLMSGTYSIKESKAPAGYNLNTECNSVKIDSGKTTNLKIYNTPNCSTKLKDIKGLIYVPNKNMINEILELYNEYPTFNGLLNFINPSCSVIDCNTAKMEINCLSANNDMKDNLLFSGLNLSCYDYKYQNKVEDYIAFCKDSFVLENNLKSSIDSITQNYTNFYSSAGRFLIKQANINGNSYLQFMHKSLDDRMHEVNIFSPYVATAMVERKCFIKSNNKNITDSEHETYFENIPNVDLYFGDVDGDGNADKLDKTDLNNLNNSSITDDISQKLNNLKNKVTIELGETLTDLRNSLTLYTSPFNEVLSTKIIGYKLKSFYIQKYTGKVSLDLENPLPNSKLATGLITGFYSSDSSGYIPFKLKYGNTSYDSDKCLYNTNSEIIEYDDEHAQTGKLQLEFRAVDSKEPFARETNSNWCDSLGNCNETNLNTLLYIKLRTNSYGVNPCGQKQKPLYTITLTSSDIQKIKDYNESNSYDNYSDSPYCDANGNCMNSFLHQLTEKTLNGASTLTNELIINENNHTVCDVKQKLQDELNKLDSTVRSKIESELEELGGIFNQNN